MEQTQGEHVRSRVERIETYFKTVNEAITSNVKLFDDIKLDNKQAYDSINRNLDDLREIYEKDLGKYEEAVDKQVTYNEALFARVEKDANYLTHDQDTLRKKLILLEKRVDDMETQIGNMDY
jgi:hypothetical protein